MNKPKITFSPLQAKQEKMVYEWLHKPHVNQWFHGLGLRNTIQGIAAFISGKEKYFYAWVAYLDGIPFGFLMTFEINDSSFEDLDPHLAKRVEKGKNSITLDLLIGETVYLGKGLGATMIEEFMRQIYPNIDVVFIDPEASNLKAIHVYEKAGFKKIDEFTASWHPVPHALMYKMF